MRRQMLRADEAEAIDETPPRGGSRFKHLLWAVAGIAIGLAVALWAGGQFEPVTSKFDGVVQGLQDASSTVQEKISDARASSRNSSLAQQVDARLKQDKEIDAARIEVSAEGEGTVILRGLVPDHSDKDKAATLARDTRGVDRVIDHLAVTPAPRVIAAGSAADVETPPRVK